MATAKKPPPDEEPAPEEASAPAEEPEQVSEEPERQVSLEGRSEGRSGPAPENDDPNTYPTPGDRSGWRPPMEE